MIVGPAETTRLEPLGEHELNALLEAASWYAKYHHRMIAEQADDPSAMAVARRDRFRALHDALDKLGVRLRRPEGLEAA
ncbi:MAG: hypothetical protein ACRDNE_17165 [Gaiellaceae bacterium]